AEQALQGRDRPARPPGGPLQHKGPAPQHRRHQGPHLRPPAGRGHHEPRRQRGQGVLPHRSGPRRPHDRPRRQEGPLAEGQLLARREVGRL
ncbi:MAG: Polyhydroxyalkanoic acid synthase, partial [uncultured Rubrobacteraceae bacterium]